MKTCAIKPAQHAPRYVKEPDLELTGKTEDQRSRGTRGTRGLRDPKGASWKGSQVTVQFRW